MTEPTPSYEDLSTIGVWVQSQNIPVPERLLSQIVTYWFCSWKPKGIPLEVYLKHWTTRIENPVDTEEEP